jgi:hypothetical protein
MVVSVRPGMTFLLNSDFFLNQKLCINLVTETYSNFILPLLLYYTVNPVSNTEVTKSSSYRELPTEQAFAPDLFFFIYPIFFGSYSLVTPRPSETSRTVF